MITEIVAFMYELNWFNYRWVQFCHYNCQSDRSVSIPIQQDCENHRKPRNSLCHATPQNMKDQLSRCQHRDAKCWLLTHSFLLEDPELTFVQTSWPWMVLKIDQLACVYIGSPGDPMHIIINVAKGLWCYQPMTSTPPNVRR